MNTETRQSIRTTAGEMPSGAAAAWIANHPPKFQVGDRVYFGRLGGERIVESIEIRQKIGQISGSFIRAYEYYVRTAGLGGVEDSFIAVEAA